MLFKRKELTPEQIEMQRAQDFFDRAVPPDHAIASNTITHRGTKTMQLSVVRILIAEAYFASWL